MGLLSEQLKKTLPGAQIDGFDISSESVERIDSNLLEQGTFTDNVNQLGRFYDVVVLSNVLHHVKPADRENLISQASSRPSARRQACYFRTQSSKSPHALGRFAMPFRW